MFVRYNIDSVFTRCREEVPSNRIYYTYKYQRAVDSNQNGMDQHDFRRYGKLLQQEYVQHYSKLLRRTHMCPAFCLYYLLFFAYKIFSLSLYSNISQAFFVYERKNVWIDGLLLVFFLSLVSKGFKNDCIYPIFFSDLQFCHLNHYTAVNRFFIGFISHSFIFHQIIISHYKGIRWIL